VRSPAKVAGVEAAGARAAVADALDRERLSEIVANAAPEVILHELTSLAAGIDLRRMDESLAMTNRFRTEVTDTLIAAARRSGARRIIVQSFCGWPFAPVGGPVKTEEDPLDPDPPAAFRRTLAAIRHAESAVRETRDLDALALRYGMFYGPGTGIAPGGALLEAVRAGRMPIVGDGAGVWSFVHVGDAAHATAAAVVRGTPGIYNVVDNEPAPVSEWLPELARAIGAAPPRRIPAWIARLAIGEGGVSMMTRIRGGSNAKAKRELGWTPRYPSWRRGFVEGLESLMDAR